MGEARGRQVWTHRTPVPCDVCTRPVTVGDPVMTGPGGRAAHEWCVLARPRARDVDKPAYRDDGMVEWRGAVYDPARARRLEPGCTRDELLLPAPDGENDIPFRGVRRN